MSDRYEVFIVTNRLGSYPGESVADAASQVALDYPLEVGQSVLIVPEGDAYEYDSVLTLIDR